MLGSMLNSLFLFSGEIYKKLGLYSSNAPKDARINQGPSSLDSMLLGC